MALAALNIDYARREFIIDSGADIWHLRASTDNEFDIWKTRLEGAWLKATEGRKHAIQDHREDKEISGEWKQVEALVDRLEMMKEFAHGMVLDLAQDARPTGLTVKKSIDNLRELSPKPKDGKPGMKIFRKREKEKSTPPSPSRDLTPQIPTTQGST